MLLFKCISLACLMSFGYDVICCLGRTSGTTQERANQCIRYVQYSQLYEYSASSCLEYSYKYSVPLIKCDRENPLSWQVINLNFFLFCKSNRLLFDMQFLLALVWATQYPYLHEL